MSTRMTTGGVSTCQTASTENTKSSVFRTDHEEPMFNTITGMWTAHCIQPSALLWKSVETNVTSGCKRKERRTRNELFTAIYARRQVTAGNKKLVKGGRRNHYDRSHGRRYLCLRLRTRLFETGTPFQERGM